MLTVVPDIPSHEALAQAIRDGENTVSDLLQAGAPVNPADGEKPPLVALNEACKKGDSALVCELLLAGADPRRFNEIGATAIHDAALNGHVACVQELLKHVGVDFRDRDDRTPLQESVQGGHLDVARVLIGHGADLGACDAMGRTPLGKVYDKLDDKPEIRSAMRDLLLDAGASPMQDGLSLVRWDMLDAVEADDKVRVRHLVQTAPGTVDREHFRLGRPMHVAARRGNAAIVKVLLRAGASAAASTTTALALSQFSKTPLQCAVNSGSLETVQMIWEALDDRERKHDGGDEPALHIAAREGLMDIAQYLLAQGADPLQSDCNDGLAQDQAKAPEMRELLRQAMLDAYKAPSRNPPPANPRSLARCLLHEGEDSYRLPADCILKKAVTSGSLNIVQRLLEAGAELLDYTVPPEWQGDDVVSIRQKTPHSEQAQTETGWNRSLARDIIDGLAEPSGDMVWGSASREEALAWASDRFNDPNGHYVNALTPLHLAAAADKPEAALKLIERGAHLAYSTHNGQTPLIYAVRRASRETVDVLLHAGADPNGRGREVPLVHACEVGNLEAVDALLQAGADPNRSLTA